MNDKVKSDGGSSDYYKIKIPKHIVKDLGDCYQIETGDVIRYAFDDNFALGNIFKALKRLGKKEGVDVAYDVNKIKYFLDDYVKAYHGAPVTKKGEWVEHTGKKMPETLNKMAAIEVMFEDGRLERSHASYWDLSWASGKIKRYRVL